MNSICFIAARGGSKGIPRKNLKILGDKPLIAHSILTAKESKLFDHIVVSTDDNEIAEISREFGAISPFMRAKKLSQNKIAYGEVLFDGIKKLKSLGYKFDFVAAVDCTVPFLTIEDFKGAMKLLKKSECDAVHSVCVSHPNPYFGMFELNNKGYMKRSKNTKYIVLTRDSSPLVYEVNGLYVHNVKSLLKNKGDMFKGKILPYVIPKERGLMIDFEIDFQLAKLILKSKKKKF